ncbi:MAG: beta-ketoacyl synthase chain length factor [Polyangiaceae bacterium]|nr:beta-ketoacyl synthase chain length factor [Polyangiaceae bacterium]
MTNDGTPPKNTSVRVIGMNALNAAGSNLEEVMQSLQIDSTALEKADRLPPEIDPLPFPATIGVIHDELSSDFTPDALNTRQLALAWKSLAPLKNKIHRLVKQRGAARIALLLGTSTGGILTTELMLKEQKESGNKQHSQTDNYNCFEAHAMDAAARHLATRLGIHGPVYALSSACASGAKAIASAQRLIDAGICDAAIAGGVDTLCRMTLHGFHSLKVLSATPCAPFQDSPKGMNVAEGAAWLLLERNDEKAAPALAFLRGIGESSDAHHISAPDPTGKSQEKAMAKALTAGNVSAQQIEYVNAHGTGTAANDAAEGPAIQRLFPQAAVSSSKGTFGHQLGAAGAAEAIVAIKALHGAELSPSGSLNRDTFLHWQRSRQERMKAEEGFVLSNSLAFGGANISLLFSKQPWSEGKAASSQSRKYRFGIQSWSSEVINPGSDNQSLGKEILAPRPRARASELTRSFASTLGRLNLSKDELAKTPMIIGSALGQLQTTKNLIDLFLAGDSSPLAFQSSVHNAVAGGLSIALKNQLPSSSVAGGFRSSTAALIEAASYLLTHQEMEKVIVLVGEESPPQTVGLPPYPTATAGIVLTRASDARPYALHFDPEHGTEERAQKDTCLPLPEETPLLADHPTIHFLRLIEAMNRGLPSYSLNEPSGPQQFFIKRKIEGESAHD